MDDEMGESDFLSAKRSARGPMLLRMFQRRLRGYRAIGYARGEWRVGDRGISDELIVEYDGETENEGDSG